MTGKKKIGIFAAVLFLLLLAAGGAFFGYVYYLPRHLLLNEFPDWLGRNQRQFRIDSIERSSPHKIFIRLLSIGNPDAPLLTAPRAVLHFDHPADRNFHRACFRKLVLEDVPLRLAGSPEGLTVNGCPAARFLELLTELPPGPDGGTIPLEINALLALPKSRERTECRIRVEREKDSGIFLFRGSWRENGRKAGGWEAHFDRGRGELNFHVSDAVTVDFLQEFLLRAGLPAALAELIQSGQLRGAGSFSADFPSLKLKLLRFNGHLEEGVLLWHGVSCQTAAPLEFTLEGTPQEVVLKWSQLVLGAPLRLNIADFQTRWRARHQNSRFTANLDVGPALLQSFDSRLGTRWSSVTPMTARLSGIINWKTGEWQCADSDDAPAAGAWQLRGEHGEELALNAERFRFEGKGSGGKGRCAAELLFRDLQFMHPSGRWQSEGGELAGQWHFNNGKTPQITLDFNLAKLIADRSDSQAEFTRPAGQLEIRPVRTGKTVDAPTQEFYLIAGAESYLITTPRGQLSGTGLRSRTVMTRQLADGAFAVQSCELSGPHAKAVGADDRRLELEEPSCWGSVAFSPDGAPGEAEFKLNAREVQSAYCRFTAPALTLRRRSMPVLWRGEFTFAQGFVGPEEQRWRAEKGSLKADTAGFLQLPEAVEFTAEDFRPRYGDWKSEWNNTVWKLKRIAATRDYTGSITAESARIQGPPGGGSVGKTELGFQITAGPHGRPEQGNVLIDARNPAWSSGARQYGGEHLNGEVKFAPGTHTASAVLKNGSLIDNHLSLLAPLVNYSGVFQEENGFSGRVRFAGGRASSDVSNLEGSDVSLDMPFVLAVPEERPFPEMRGKLSIAKLAFLGHPEGSLEASLRQLPAGLRATGKFLWSKFSEGQLHFDTAVDWSPRRCTGTFAMKPAPLREPLNFNFWYPGSNTVAVAGKFGLDGTLESTPSGAKINAVVQALDSDWQIQSALLEGVSGTMEFSDLRKLISGNDAELRARRFRWRQWELAGNRFQLAFQGSGTGTISNWTGSFGSGTVRLAEPVHFLYGTTAPDTPTELKLAAENIPLSPFFAKLGVEAAEGQAGLSGTVRAEYQRGSLRFLPSSLGFRAPAGELLGFGTLERYAVTIADANYQAFTLAVLKAMRCTSAQFDFEEEDHMLQMRIKADGAPAAPVPFVYQGHQAEAPFRNAKPGENGFDGELELTVDLKLNLSQEGETSAPENPSPTR